MAQSTSNLATPFQSLLAKPKVQSPFQLGTTSGTTSAVATPKAPNTKTAYNAQIDSIFGINQPVPAVSTPASQPTYTPASVARTVSTAQPISSSNPNAGSQTPGLMGMSLPTQPQQSAQQPLLPTPTQAPTTFPGIVSNLATFNPLSNPQVSSAYQKAQDITTQLEQSRKNEADAEAQNRLNPIPIGDQTGREAVIRNQYLAQQNALAQEASAQSTLFGAGLTGTGQQASALGAAAGYAQPQLGQYGQTYYSPLGAGQPTGGTGGLDPQSQATQLAQLVNSGQITYDDALSQMGSYGTIGAPSLRNAILSGNPNFNFAQAQALGTTQGQVAPQLNMAQTALNNLNNTFASVPSWQKTGIPALNSLANLFSGLTGVGLGSESAKQNAIKEARTQVANALGTMTNTTPTSWTATVESWFPDNATPQQIEAGAEQFSILAGNRQQIYGNPGSVQPFTPQINANTNQPLTWETI